MSDLPGPFPCWPCVGKTIVIAKSLVQGSRGQHRDEILDEILDGLLRVDCSWDLEGNKYLDGRCTECIRMRHACGTVLSLLEERTKDLGATMAYIDMTINLNRRVQHVTRPASSSWQKPQYLSMEDQYCSSEIRVLPFKARKGMVAATTKLGIRLTTIVESLKGNHDPLKTCDQSINHKHTQIGCPAPIRPSLAENPNESPAQLRRHNTTQTDFLSWNAIVREFHSDILKALRSVELDGDLVNTIMERIPIKWIPGVSKEVLEDAQDAILQCAPVIQYPPEYIPPHMRRG
ncbi:hypothetical protein NCS52_01254500 [Fusarium sp. LHS14.1]|nr:hypothetical protein NCS52_01254500 [Fusarium sp. LHS14.1]